MDKVALVELHSCEHVNWLNAMATRTVRRRAEPQILRRAQVRVPLSRLAKHMMTVAGRAIESSGAQVSEAVFRHGVQDPL